ncbi:hypothetical protein HLV39_04560 [Marinobacter adhaerens]|uniref:Secreted protein n=1 Tax=Marinobacter adhaerens TaxID=1033846 RepID=A0A851HLP9_9GAMM|nr:hypothetical protein [Marinobacter adhaerens]NWN90769.1 hypothetical protein [Marinobacter adhaerens]
MSPSKYLAICLLVLTTAACTAPDTQSLETQVCSEEWFEKVERQIPTGDGQGHGPDTGSLEWRSVVEFRLGIRGNEAVPARDSDQWCNYIDEQFIE